MVSCADGCAAVLPCGRSAVKARLAEELAPPPPDDQPSQSDAHPAFQPASDLEVVVEYARLRSLSKNQDAVALFSENATWVTLYQQVLSGREQIKTWMDQETQAGRANLVEGDWEEDGECYSRELTTKFPRGGLHEVIQSVEVSKRQITTVRIKPKWKAHGVVIDFANLRANGDNEAALEHMADGVRWKTWDNVEVQGKEKVMELMSAQTLHGDKRVGMSDFEALGEVTDEQAIFERAMQIERLDGVKVRATQTLTISGDPLKIVEVYMHPEEELKDGSWSAPLEREKSETYQPPLLGKQDDAKKKAPKCGCTTM